MYIKAIETFLVTLPFRFPFAHSLATHENSTNIVVRVTLDDGTQGYGEGVPRDYVTGEDAEQSRRNIDLSFAPLFIGANVSDPRTVLHLMEATFDELGLVSEPKGPAWCALELAILDAVTKVHEHRVLDWFGPPMHTRVRYGAVIPFGGKNASTAMLMLYKIFGFQTVKIKVGKSLEEDVAKVSLARKLLGDNATIRVDANCAWTVDETLRAAEAFRPYGVVSIEQPVANNDLDGMKRITDSIPEQVIADESLCTIADAEQLARKGIVNGFNIRLSKVGGMLAARRIVDIAREHGVKCHLGAQVGESAILSAAARTFALVNSEFENYEGSVNGFLLTKDITCENLTVLPGGYGDLRYSKKQPHGFGFSISEGTLESWAQHWPASTTSTAAQEVAITRI